MKVIWMVQAEEAVWVDGHPEYYRIIFDDGEFQGQYYSPQKKRWIGNSKSLAKMKWLFVKTDILITEIGDYDDNMG